MVVPNRIDDPSPLDPMLLLPVPSTLPKDPRPSIQPLLAAIEQCLADPGSSPLPIATLTSQMRQIWRNSHVLLNAARAATAEARERLDQVDVDLRGVEYERNRVRDEIAKCEDYE